MRKLILTPSFEEFYKTSSNRLAEKIDYALTILEQIDVPSTKFIKKLRGSRFYELRISAEKEYRVLLSPIDTANIIEARQVLVLQGFQKKSTKDYNKQIAIAERIIGDLL
jgi:Phage derived protein Gp49-like (DUF891).